MRPRFRLPTQSIGRAPLPIRGARFCRRTLRHLRHFGKMRARGLGLVEVAKRNPAREKVLLGTETFLDRKSSLADDSVAFAGILQVHQHSADVATQNPPFVRIVNYVRIAWRREQ